ncbi:hypothetical protein ACFY19_10755 [Streptosporangium saharense]|uniref:hypothetical protein n=1 Tax=Streptosporangium saharense TaxID=1706840 RepID=UPI0036AD7D51
MSDSGRAAPYAWPYALASVLVAAGVAGVSVAIVTDAPRPPAPGPDPGLSRVVTGLPEAEPYPQRLRLPPRSAVVLVPPVARPAGRAPEHATWGRERTAPRQNAQRPKTKVRRPATPRKRPVRQGICAMLDGLRRAYCEAVLDGLSGR